MKDKILSQASGELEKLYRSNKIQFKREFSELYPEVKGNPLADCWYERLNYESDEINWGSRRDLIFLVFAALVAGFIAKMPAIFNMNEEYFYSRNVGFIIFPALTAFFVTQNKLSIGKIATIVVTTLAGLLFINLLPDNKQS